MILYRLEHYHKTNGYDQVIYIGLFDSKENIEEAIELLILQKGFRLHSREAFKIIAVKVDDIYWEKGFKSIDGEDIEIT